MSSLLPHCELQDCHQCNIYTDVVPTHSICHGVLVGLIIMETAMRSPSRMVGVHDYIRGREGGEGVEGSLTA